MVNLTANTCTNIKILEEATAKDLPISCDIKQGVLYFNDKFHISNCGHKKNIHGSLIERLTHTTITFFQFLFFVKFKEPQTAFPDIETKKIEACNQVITVLELVIAEDKQHILQLDNIEKLALNTLHYNGLLPVLCLDDPDQNEDILETCFLDLNKKIYNLSREILFKEFSKQNPCIESEEIITEVTNLKKVSISNLALYIQINKIYNFCVNEDSIHLDESNGWKHLQLSPKPTIIYRVYNTVISYLAPSSSREIEQLEYKIMTIQKIFLKTLLAIENSPTHFSEQFTTFTVERFITRLLASGKLQKHLCDQVRSSKENIELANKLHKEIINCAKRIFLSINNSKKDLVDELSIRSKMPLAPHYFFITHLW
ncbi:MAG: hypothetical protein VX777_02840 [Chlamydiota bacterium]|nr:hypothetical protein [Chlamydiota bacterium]